MASDKSMPRVGPVVWLLAAAVLVRLVSLALTPVVNPDSCRYINAAHQFLAGNATLGLAYAGSLPTYPWLLIAVHALIPDWVLAGQLLSALCLILAVIPFYLLTRDLFGPQAALWGGLAFVLSPELNKYAGEIIREPAFALAFLWTTYFARRALVDPKPLDFLWVALLALLSVSLRFEMAAFYLGFPPLLLFFALRDRQRRGAWLKGLAIFLAIPAVLLLALLPVLAGSAGDIRLGGGVNAFLGRLLAFDWLGTYPTVYARLAAIEPTFPEAQFAHDAVETARHLLPLIYLLGLGSALIASLSPLFAALAAWGIIRRPLEAPAARPLLFLVGFFLLATYFVLINRNFISDRYLLPPMLLLLPWAGWGMHCLLERLRALRAATRWAACAVVLFVAVPAADTVGNWERGPGVQQAAGAWLKESPAQSGARLLVNDERIPLYAGYWMGEYQFYPQDDLAGLEAFALEQGSTLLAVRVSRKKLAGLPEMKQFRLVKKLEDDKAAIGIFEKIIPSANDIP